MPKTKKTINEQKIKPIPQTKINIGIDTDKTIVDNIIQGAQIGGLDISSIDALSQNAQTREQTYQLIDSMTQDSLIGAVLETYVEDTIQTNDKGQIIWAESDNVEISNYVNWLLSSLNIEKQLYQWTYSLITYGDLYVRLFRKSDEEDDLLFKENKNNVLNESLNNHNLNEDIKINVYSNKDKYVNYVEMVPNPGEMFDLQKFGKTHGFIKAPTSVIQSSSDALYTYLTNYKMNQSDIEIFDGTSFVHACMENTNQRKPETVDIYLDNNINNDFNTSSDESKHLTTSYSVKRGQSILYNSFRDWRELNLLEMSALLNRLTRSAVVRILSVDTGDMPKEQVQAFMQRLKDKIEQKSALNTNKSMAEYNNPGPIENTIYVPVHGTQGQISASSIGGDFDPKSLVDIEYFRDRLFGSLKVPKQFFGFTEDGAGFNGGASLTIISSRYGKTIKNIQFKLCQIITDIVNLFSIDRGLNNYINRFKIRMQTPSTQEEIDRRSAADSRVQNIGNLMQQFEGIEDNITKLKIQKCLLTECVNNSEVMNLMQEYIDKLEVEKNKQNNSSQSEKAEENNDNNSDLNEMPKLEDLNNNDNKISKDIILEDSKDDTSYLPSAEELNVDMTEEDNK